MQSNSILLKTASELGLTNPVEVLWELVPFSFVIDWALPIGSFISQFDASLGWTFVDGSITRAYRREATKKRSIKTPPPSGYARIDCDVVRSVEDFTLTRTGFSSWLDLMSIPYVKDPATFTHIANALALLTSKR
jgi:hypothetical protein